MNLTASYQKKMQIRPQGDLGRAEVPAPLVTRLSVAGESHVMMKAKPQIRIVHLRAPEIIKTDVAHFRELVQRLTGKQAVVEHRRQKKKARRMSKPVFMAAQIMPTTAGDIFSGRFGSEELCFSGRVKEEAVEQRWGDIWMGGLSDGIHAGEFGEYDGLLQGFLECQQDPLDTLYCDLFGSPVPSS